MSEPKYVKIREELRDKLVALRTPELSMGMVDELRAAPSIETPEQRDGAITRESLFTLLSSGVMAHKPELREQAGRYELDFSPTIGPLATDLFKFIQANQLPAPKDKP